MAWKARHGVKWQGAAREVDLGIDTQEAGRSEWMGIRERPPKVKSGPQLLGVCVRHAFAAALAIGLAFAPEPAISQTSGDGFSLVNGNLQKRVNGVLSLMQYTLFPDVTTSSLAISSGTTGNPDLNMVQAGGGFTVSRSFPLYLEGNAAFSRYDPTFIATNGTETREIPAKWTTVTGTVGVGWDFPLTSLTPELVLRPIVNFTLGHMESDLSAAVRIIEGETDKELGFLGHGRLNAVGCGGSLMLDYEHYRRDYEIDVETRYTTIYLQSIPGTSEGVKGSYLAQNLNLWSRWRAPIGLTALHRPVRYVLEFTYSHYFGNQDDILGFNNLFSIGTGLELDVSRYQSLFITRIRLIARYRFGENVSGWTIGLGISF
jgi:hypothetical protein